MNYYTGIAADPSISKVNARRTAAISPTSLRLDVRMARAAWWLRNDGSFRFTHVPMTPTVYTPPKLDFLRFPARTNRSALAKSSPLGVLSRSPTVICCPCLLRSGQFKTYSSDKYTDDLKHHLRSSEAPVCASSSGFPGERAALAICCQIVACRKLAFYDVEGFRLYLMPDVGRAFRSIPEFSTIIAQQSRYSRSEAGTSRDTIVRSNTPSPRRAGGRRSYVPSSGLVLKVNHRAFNTYSAGPPRLNTQRHRRMPCASGKDLCSLPRVEHQMEMRGLAYSEETKCALSALMRAHDGHAARNAPSILSHSCDRSAR
ncbi:hypothetical protein B0H10DRAFT_2206728 [Mycena sp. CBHHK59/15]|nr:hypothetical protein B0H10DRAFT_2206728 [Mycena sp. CBHHK59/15]